VERLLIQVEDGGIRRAAATSYGSAVVYGEDTRDLVLVVEGMGAVAPMLDGERGFSGTIPTVPRPGTEVGAGPRGGAWVDGRLVVDAWIDHALAVFPDRYAAWTPGSPVDALPLAEEALDPEVAAGRRMFFSARDRRTSVVVGGVSCATCHFQGRNDGFTWPHVTGAVQTPSLAGVVSETLPVPWSGAVATAGEEAHLTATLRMGGEGLSEEERAQVAAYLDSTPLPDRPEGEARAVARGEDAFGRAGCGACHAGPRYTDNAEHAVAGFATPTNTPPLTGVGATAPYFHDGSAPTLRALLERVRDGSMGDTSDLSDAERADLEAFLRSR
jgi:mono/diheme cytochrome c family protein